MTVDELLAEIVALLRKRAAYRSYKRRFDARRRLSGRLKAELIDAKRLAVDEDGKVLVWIGEGRNGEKEKRGNGEKGEGRLESSVQSLESKPMLTRRNISPSAFALSKQR